MHTQKEYMDARIENLRRLNELKVNCMPYMEGVFAVINLFLSRFENYNIRILPLKTFQTDTMEKETPAVFVGLFRNPDLYFKDLNEFASTCDTKFFITYEGQSGIATNFYYTKPNATLGKVMQNDHPKVAVRRHYDRLLQVSTECRAIGETFGLGVVKGIAAISEMSPDWYIRVDIINIEPKGLTKPKGGLIFGKTAVMFSVIRGSECFSMRATSEEIAANSVIQFASVIGKATINVDNIQLVVDGYMVDNENSDTVGTTLEDNLTHA